VGKIIALTIDLNNIVVLRNVSTLKYSLIIYTHSWRVPPPHKNFGFDLESEVTDEKKREGRYI